VTGDCIFCAIASGEAEAEIVHADDDSVAFLDFRPLFHGHTLLIPRAHHETLADLPEELVGCLFLRARRLSVAPRQGRRAARVLLAPAQVLRRGALRDRGADPRSAAAMTTTDPRTPG
jgi:histidine triad (HIT) family protein